jgi:hypothetical protein
MDKFDGLEETTSKKNVIRDKYSSLPFFFKRKKSRCQRLSSSSQQSERFSYSNNQEKHCKKGTGEKKIRAKKKETNIEKKRLKEEKNKKKERYDKSKETDDQISIIFSSFLHLTLFIQIRLI